MQAGQSSQHLTIAAPRDLTTKWLNARLAAHMGSEAGLQFLLVSADELARFHRSQSRPCHPPGRRAGEHEGVKLDNARFVTVAGPGGTGADAPIAWPGCPVEDGKAVMRVADAGLAIDAAASGFGRACVPELLARADIETGRVAQVGEMRPGQGLLADCAAAAMAAEEGQGAGGGTDRGLTRDDEGRAPPVPFRGWRLPCAGAARHGRFRAHRPAVFRRHPLGAGAGDPVWPGEPRAAAALARADEQRGAAHADAHHADRGAARRAARRGADPGADVPSTPSCRAARSTRRCCSTEPWRACRAGSRNISSRWAWAIFRPCASRLPTGCPAAPGRSPGRR